MESERSLPCLQQPVTCRYPQPDESIPKPPIQFQIHFNIILQYTSRFPWLFLSWALFQTNCVCTDLHFHACYMSSSYPPWGGNSNNIYYHHLWWSQYYRLYGAECSNCSKWVGNEGENSPGISQGTIRKSGWRNWARPGKPWLRIVGVPTEFRTRDLTSNKYTNHSTAPLRVLTCLFLRNLISFHYLHLARIKTERVCFIRADLVQILSYAIPKPPHKVEPAGCRECVVMVVMVAWEDETGLRNRLCIAYPLRPVTPNIK